jgi:hypothetical protein
MRLALVDILSGGRLSPGEAVINLGRVIQAFPETDVTTMVKYRIEKQRNPHLALDIEKDDFDALMVDLYPNAAFPVSVIQRDGKAYSREMTFNTAGVVYAFEDPQDSTQTVLSYEEDEASPLVTYHLDMPLITTGGGGTVGFLNLFNSDSDGVPAASPTSAPEPPTPAPQV